MKGLHFLLIVLLSISFSAAQTFDDFINQLNSTPENERQALVDSFMNSVSQFPYLEQDTLCHFIYQGNANSVTVPGDANNWDPNASPMTHIGGTNFWYRTDVFESDARLDYKFVLNGSNWILDPLNPHTILGGFGPNSELRMPDYVMPPEIDYYPNIPHGSFLDTTFYSTHLGNSRTIRVYLPPGYYSTSDSFAVLVVHDGLEYITLANSDNVLDYLIDQNLIEPVIGVFVPPVNRNEEYIGNLQDEFTAFITDELIPWVDGRFRTKADPHYRATMGSSAGGNISLWLGLTHPEVFGNVAAQSSYIQSSIFDGFQNGPTLDLQIYMNLGTYDLPIIIQLVQSFIPILQDKGYSYQYGEYHEGHSWGLWRAHIDDALMMFFPGPALGINQLPPVPERMELFQNYPNPFNPTTNITYRVSDSGLVELVVYDVLGQQVKTLVKKVQSPGTYTVQWDGSNQEGSTVSSGIYFYQLKQLNRASQKSQFRKMLFLK